MIPTVKGWENEESNISQHFLFYGSPFTVQGHATHNNARRQDVLLLHTPPPPSPSRHGEVETLLLSPSLTLLRCFHLLYTCIALTRFFTYNPESTPPSQLVFFKLIISTPWTIMPLYLIIYYNQPPPPPYNPSLQNNWLFFHDEKAVYVIKFLVSHQESERMKHQTRKKRQKTFLLIIPEIKPGQPSVSWNQITPPFTAVKAFIGNLFFNKAI